MAYELLYRSSIANEAGTVGPVESAAAIASALMEIGLERLVGSKTAYINVGEFLLSGHFVEALPPERIVLEILEDTQPTPEVLEALQVLKLQGYRFALDDYTFQPELKPFLEFVDIVKLDIASVSAGQLAKHLPALRSQGKKLLAEKVETPEEFEQCHDCAFDLYQGYFFARPTVLKGRGIQSNRAALLNLMYRLQQPDVQIREIERIITADVALTYKLFRLVRSALIAAPSSISTISQAVMFLGLKTTAAVASLLALSAVEDKPNELFVLALVRAKMCELLSGGGFEASEYFTVGLFSVLDAFLEAPMQEIVDGLPLSAEVRAALVDPSADGKLAQAIGCVRAYEQGNWEGIGASIYDPSLVERAYIEAVDWADQTVRVILTSSGAGKRMAA